MKPQQGFTLIEMLVAGVLGVFILGIGLMQLQVGVKNTTSIYNQQQMMEDFRNTGNYIADNLSAAGYIFPSGAVITLGSGDYSVKNPLTSSNVWTLGTHPMVAMLLHPRDSTAACTLGVSENGCVRFMAFYAVARSTVVTQAPANENPGADPQNDATSWTLYAYQQAINATSLKKYLEALDAASLLDKPSYTTSKGSLLADYLKTSAFVVTYLNCLVDGNIQATCVNAQSSASRLTFSMAGSMKRGSSIVYAPSDKLQFQAASRNLLLF
ncbi:PilW family protein [Deinococcus roseus]|uniref:Prepilin-type N-terminal cleavage/methylation domain-containing protein n=1 Tax=Deinococcus roseus TaxID=392414 RepID=A0ABQ2DD93_9DEIO|nr:prepilin-type N-terminal cleavage/methylation domain-containing protein [Deinococcus roseus]GGJ53979.1 hypothetical protein GCM10008938_45050 [Deinococcus roseus]